jgi:hypothetical protein
MARLSLLPLGSRQESKDTTTAKIQQGKQQDCAGIDMTPLTTRFHCTVDFVVLVFLSFVYMLSDFSAFFSGFLRANLRLPCVFSVLRNLTNPPNIICGLAIFCYFNYLFIISVTLC